jgi:hypothetical protein
MVAFLPLRSPKAALLLGDRPRHAIRLPHSVDPVNWHPSLDPAGSGGGAHSFWLEASGDDGFLRPLFASTHSITRSICTYNGSGGAVGRSFQTTRTRSPIAHLPPMMVVNSPGPSSSSTMALTNGTGNRVVPAYEPLSWCESCPCRLPAPTRVHPPGRRDRTGGRRTGTAPHRLHFWRTSSCRTRRLPASSRSSVAIWALWDSPPLRRGMWHQPNGVGTDDGPG